MSGGVEKLMARGVGKRAALRRIARKHGINPRSVHAMIARADRPEGGMA
jgi:phosphoserine phosphatase